MPVLYCTTSASLPRWDGSRVLFDITDGGNQVPCAISRMALEEIGEAPCGTTAELLGCFARARGRIEGFALDKLHSRPLGVSGRLSLWADDLDDLPPGGVSVSGRFRVACLRSA